ncbi:MAG: DUF3592 domain-containing protein [Planctomycetota bacterium]|jgi:hypothetical protein
MRRRGESKKTGAGCLLLFGIPFLGAGLFVLGLVGRSWLIYLDAAGWAEVPATIEHAEIKRHRGDKSTTYSVECRYSYEYKGKRYSSTRVAPMGGSSGEHELHARRCRILKEHMGSGEPFPALVDPERPGFSILFRETDIFMYIGFPFGLVFALVGAGVMAGGIVAKRAMKREGEKRKEFGDRPWLFRDDWRESKSVPATGRKLAMAWGVGLGLPLFVSMFVVAIVLSDAPLFAKIIVGVFVVIAALTFLNAVVTTLRFAVHGTPELVLSRVPFAPGEKLVAVVRARGHVAPAGVSMRLTINETRGEGAAAPKRDLGGEKTSSMSSSTGNRTTSEIYRQTIEFDPSMSNYDGRHTLLPVAFDIPAHLPPCARKGDGRIVWKLAVKAKAFPVSLKTEFDLPVFEADESDVGAQGRHQEEHEKAR